MTSEEYKLKFAVPTLKEMLKKMTKTVIITDFMSYNGRVRLLMAAVEDTRSAEAASQVRIPLVAQEFVWTKSIHSGHANSALCTKTGPGMAYYPATS